jgi:glycine/D-amino acid oxidase-like deaminating enzyme
MQYDFLIVGQGIAGTTLAMELIAQGSSVLVIDAYNKSSSSQVAAGLYNPIAFRRVALGWKANECLKEVRRFYSGQEELTETHLFYPKDILRIHGSAEEVVIWNKRMQDPEFADLLGETTYEQDSPYYFQPFGVSKVLGGGFVDTRTWLSAVRRIFLSRNILREEHFEIGQLEILSEGVQYKEIRANKVIFCEGADALQNPWFGHLPFNLAKGDVVIIHAPELPLEIFNGSIYGIPLGEGVFRVGSTYEWDFSDALPSKDRAIELEDKLKSLIRVPFKIIGHEAGIRPTVKDRRPFLGTHQDINSLAIFNGLGTKGVLLAPLLAKEMALHLIHGNELSDDVNIARLLSRKSYS